MTVQDPKTRTETMQCQRDDLARRIAEQQASLKPIDCDHDDPPPVPFQRVLDGLVKT